MKKDLLSINDLEKEDVLEIFEIAKKIDSFKKKYLQNKFFALIFEKPSLRTRVTFEIGIKQLGGNAIYLSQRDIRFNSGESIKDISQNLSLWCDGIIARVYSHLSLQELAKYSSIPVINALSELEHPCQALTDIFTVLQSKKNKNLKICYVGDGSNNVCHSLILLSTKMGINISVASPDEYFPRKEVLNIAKQQAKNTKCCLEICSCPQTAVKQADAVYTDVWVSMGQEKERKKRLGIFPKYQVNLELLKFAKKDAIVLHCLPAHRGQEITSDVLDGEQSNVLRQAKNRLVIQKALLIWLYKKIRKG